MNKFKMAFVISKLAPLGEFVYYPIIFALIVYSFLNGKTAEFTGYVVFFIMFEWRNLVQREYSKQLNFYQKTILSAAKDSMGLYDALVRIKEGTKLDPEHDILIECYSDLMRAYDKMGLKDSWKKRIPIDTKEIQNNESN